MNPDNFGYLRKKFFPVHRHEVKKIVPLNLLFFFVTANYGLLRAMKDMFILDKGGAKLIAQVKFWGVIPAMVVFKWAYDTLSSRTGTHGRLYGLLVYFGFIFFLFHFVLKQYVAPISDDMTMWEQFLNIWPLVVFYIHAEAWGTFMLSVSCWTFANQITSVEQAKRCYSIVSIGAAIATYLAGYAIVSLPDEEVLMKIVFLNVVLFALLYHWFTGQIKKNPALYEIPPSRAKKKKKKMGFVESIKFLFRSKDAFYLGLILLLVIGYSLSGNLFEAVYRDWTKSVGKIKEQEGLVANHRKFLLIMGGRQLQWIGIISLLLILFLATPIRSQGWRFTALVVPVVLLIGSVIFSSTVYFEGFFANYSKRWGFTELRTKEMIMWLGLAVVAFVKSSKYVFFDTTKEATYIPLDEVSKVNGKSAVDGVGSRFGKAGGSVVIQLLTSSLIGYPTALEAKGILAVFVLAMVCTWIWGVVTLDKEYHKLIKRSKQPAQKS